MRAGERLIILICTSLFLTATLDVRGARACEPPPLGCRRDTCSTGGCLELPPTPPGGGGPGGILPIGLDHAPQTVYVPTCPGNNPDGADALCGAALSNCPDPVATAFWVFIKTWDPVTGAYGIWNKQLAPRIACFGPGAVGVNPVLAALAQVRAEWKTYDLPASSFTVRPAAGTLVGAVTQFSSNAPLDTDLPPKTILGFAVTLHITATRYVWDFGDGELVAQAAGNGSPSAVHTYRATGVHHVRLETFYTATFSVGADPARLPLAGVADVLGPNIALQAAQARTQLESGAR